MINTLKSGEDLQMQIWKRFSAISQDFLIKHILGNGIECFGITCPSKKGNFSTSISTILMRHPHNTHVIWGKIKINIFYEKTVHTWQLSWQKKNLFILKCMRISNHCQNTRVQIVQGTTKRLRPGLGNKRRKNCAPLLAAGRRTQIFPLLFTKLGRSLLVVPCTKNR